LIVSVASGKGGTGKTTVAVNLALSLQRSKDVTLVDCDVEEPNLHLFLHPSVQSVEDVTLPVPEIDENKCTNCGQCVRSCVFNALAMVDSKVMVFSEMCHGCGVCSYVCPVKAVKEKPVRIGIIEKGSASKNIEFCQGRLDVGTAIATPIIKHIRKDLDKRKTVIIDASPGTSCPVIQATIGSDFCILVTEPTPFGLHDLTLAATMLKKINVKPGVIINRVGIGSDAEIEDFCLKNKIPIIMKIPYREDFAKVYSKGELIVEHFPEWEQKFLQLWRDIEGRACS
jgi:MinD superfamily P-loop ATPase